VSSDGNTVIVPFPPSLEQAPAATRIRSTLLVSSLRALRRRELFDSYARFVAPEQVETITSAVAGIWLPIDLGVAHYRACDALRLPLSEQLLIGAEVVREMQQTFLGTLVKLSASAGVTPWAGLRKFSTIYERMFDGGGVCITQLGPKDARAEVVGLPLASIGYFRNAYRGFIQAGCEFFSARVYVVEATKFCSSTTVGYRVSWV
jgi:hypothetical protein